CDLPHACAAGSAYYVVARSRNALQGRDISTVRGLRVTSDMRRCLTLVVGVLIGQWLAFGAHPSPADLHRLRFVAWERHDCSEARRSWSHGAGLRPGDAVLQFWRASALARQELASLDAASVTATEAETTDPMEPSRGVWVASVVNNGDRRARFLVDTGSSVTL